MTHRCFTVLGFPGVRQFIDLILGVVKVQGQLRGRREHMLAYRGGKTESEKSSPNI